MGNQQTGGNQAAANQGGGAAVPRGPAVPDHATLTGNIAQTGQGAFSPEQIAAVMAYIEAQNAQAKPKSGRELIREWLEKPLPLTYLFYVAEQPGPGDRHVGRHAYNFTRPEERVPYFTLPVFVEEHTPILNEFGRQIGTNTIPAVTLEFKAPRFLAGSDIPDYSFAFCDFSEIDEIGITEAEIEAYRLPEGTMPRERPRTLKDVSDAIWAMNLAKKAPDIHARLISVDVVQKQLREKYLAKWAAEDANKRVSMALDGASSIDQLRGVSLDLARKGALAGA